MAGVPGISRSTSAAPALSTTAGTCCRSGRITCGRRSCCVNRSVGSAPGSTRRVIHAAGHGPRWSTMCGRIAGTGRCSSTRPITRACASITTTRRPRENRPKNGAKTVRFRDGFSLGSYARAPAYTQAGGRMRGCVRRKPRRGFQPSPHPKKVSQALPGYPASPHLREKFPNRVSAGRRCQ